ncbi:hypothetical protein HDV63DRAFT_365230 [Trichoderma sp. SZMC 28014]
MDLLRYLYASFSAIFKFFRSIFFFFFTNTGGKIGISAFTIPYTPRLHQGRESGVGKSCLIYIFICKAK